MNELPEVPLDIGARSADEGDDATALVLSRQEFLGLLFALLYADVITEAQATYYAYGYTDYGVPPYGGAVHFSPESDWQE